jgi:hypothetical protein
MADMVSEYYLRPGYTFADEFDVGLALVLDALDAALRAGTVTRAPRDPLPETAAKNAVS